MNTKSLAIRAAAAGLAVLLAGCGTSEDPADALPPQASVQPWEAPRPIEYGTLAGALDPLAGMDGNGNAISIWIQGHSGNSRLWSNRGLVGAGWGEPQPISAEGIDVVNARLAVSESGDAIAAWQVYSGDEARDLWVRLYRSNFGWGPAEAVMIHEGYSSHVVSMDRYGGALVAWVQHGATDAILLAKRYKTEPYPLEERGWGDPELVGSALHSILELDVSGRDGAFLVWAQSDDEANFNPNQIRASYRLETGWSVPDVVDSGPERVHAPRVAMDSQGKTLVAWRKHAEAGLSWSPQDLWVRRFDPATGWGPASIMASGADAYEGPRIAMNGGGEAILVWKRDVDGPRDIRFVRFDPAAGWGAAGGFGLDNSWIKDLQAAVAENGDAMVAWHDIAGDGSSRIRAARFSEAGGWGGIEPVATDDAGSVIGLALAANPGGSAALVWQQVDAGMHNIGGLRSILASRRGP